MKYDGAMFLARVAEHQLLVRGRTGPTGCWVCDVLVPAVSQAEKLRQSVTEEAFVAQQRARCALVSGGIVDAHHCGLPKRVLKRYFRGAEMETLLMDPRNGIIVRRHHHDQLESRHLAIPNVLLPADTLAFVDELGMRWYLDDLEGRRADAGR